MSNLFAKFKKLIDKAPLQAGVVLSIADGVAVVELPDGGRILARGGAAEGDAVFVRDGVIEGAAPNLPPESISV